MSEFGFTKLTMNAPRFSLTNLGPSKQTKRIIHNLLIVKVSTRKSGRTCIFSLGSKSKARKGATKVEGLEALLLKNYRGGAGAY